MKNARDKRRVIMRITPADNSELITLHNGRHRLAPVRVAHAGAGVTLGHLYYVDTPPRLVTYYKPKPTKK